VQYAPAVSACKALWQVVTAAAAGHAGISPLHGDAMLLCHSHCWARVATAAAACLPVPSQVLVTPPRQAMLVTVLQTASLLEFSSLPPCLLHMEAMHACRLMHSSQHARVRTARHQRPSQHSQPPSSCLAADDKARLPDSWCIATREAVTRLQQELGLPHDLQSRDKRKHTLRVRSVRRDSAALSEDSCANSGGLQGAEAVQAWMASSLAEEDDPQERAAAAAVHSRDVQSTAAVCGSGSVRRAIGSTVGSSSMGSEEGRVKARTMEDSGELLTAVAAAAPRSRPAAAAGVAGAGAAPVQEVAGMPRCTSAVDLAASRNSSAGLSRNSSSQIRHVSDGAFLRDFPAGPHATTAAGAAAQQRSSSSSSGPGSPSLQGQLHDLQLPHHEVCAVMNRLEALSP
jgi:hypothetical protein